MDKSLAIAGNAMQLIEEFYPEYLTQSGQQDCWLARCTFYAMIIESVDRLPLSDNRAQTLLVCRLGEEWRNANSQLQDELFKYLIER